jgi:hypothetical protein
MSWGTIATVAASVIGSVIAGSSAKSSAKKAAEAQVQGSDAQIALAAAQMQMAQGLMQPYVDRGGRSQAMLDALTYGEGSYTAQPSFLQQQNQNSLQARLAAGPTEAELMAMFPEQASRWQGWEAASAKKAGKNSLLDLHPAHAKRGIEFGGKEYKHRAAFGDFAGYLAAEPTGDYQQKLAAWRADLEAQLAAQQSQQTDPNQAYTRSAVEDLIRQSMPYQIGEQSYATQSGIADSAYGALGDIDQQGLDRQLGAFGQQRSELGAIEAAGYQRDLDSYSAEEAAALGIESAGLARDVDAYGQRRDTMRDIERSGRERDLGTYGARRDDARGIEAEGYARDLGLYDDELDARFGLAGQEWEQGIDLAGFNRGQREAETARARAALRGVADENFSNTSGLLSDSYATRQGLTTNAVNAWDAQAQAARDRAVDANFSRGGVTGLIGQTRAGVADVEQSYARDRAIYEGDRRLQDFNAYDEGLQGADLRRGAGYTGAEQTATAQGWDTVNSYAGDLQGAQDTYYGRLNPAVTDYYDSYAARSGRNTSALQGISDQYYGSVAERDALNTLRELGIDEAFYNDLIQRYGSNTAALQAINQRSAAQRNERSETNTANLANQAQQYWDDTAGAYADNDAARRAREQWYADQRAQNAAQRSAAQQASYADYTGLLRGDANRGYNASQLQAGYGADYTDNAIASTGRAADAATGYALARGQVNQDMYGQIANTIGNAFTTAANRNNQSRYSYAGTTGRASGSGVGGVIRNGG